MVLGRPSAAVEGERHTSANVDGASTRSCKGVVVVESRGKANELDVGGQGAISFVGMDRSRSVS